MSQQLFDIEISGDLLAAIPRIKDQDGYARAMARAMDKQNQLTIRRIQQGHLSGPTTASSLSWRTRLLIHSVNASKPIIQGTGITSTIGSNVIYAKRHEFGFDGDENVRAHMRRPATYRKFRFGGKTIKKEVQGADIMVRGFKRHVHTPARAPFGHGIADCLPDYTAAFESATKDYLEGKT